MPKELNILIVDDNEMMAKTLQDIFRLKGFQTDVAHSGSEALAKIESSTFDCVLSDIKMPNISGVELFRAIKAHQPGLPVVLMTAYTTDKLIDEGLTEGVIAVLTKPLDIKLLLEFLAYLRQERSIVIVDDDPAFCRTLGDILQRQGFQTRQITRPDRVMDQLEAEGQVVILDMKLNGRDGLDVLREIKARYPDLPVILVTGYQEEVSAALETGLKISAYTYFGKPLPIDKLLHTLTEIHHHRLGLILGRASLKGK